MVSRSPKRGPAPPPRPRWRILRIAGAANRYIGSVTGPPTREEALKRAVTELVITDPEHRRGWSAFRDN
jgi:hypothetical protein